MTNYEPITKKLLLRLVGKRVVVDCGDSRLGAFTGLELSGTLSHKGKDDFVLDTGTRKWPFNLDDVGWIEEVSR